jgi:membrane associated rhomboid family serine protease
MEAMVNEAAPRQPFFNRQPAVALGLGGLILLAHLVREYGPKDARDWLYNALNVTPSDYEAPIADWNWLPLFGHVFVHADFLHLAFNLAIFFALSGRVVERLGAAGGGWWRYLVLFFGSAAGGVFTFMFINPFSDANLIGASGAVCGLFAAMLMGARWDWRSSIRDPQVLRTGAGFLFAVVGVAFVASFFGILPIAWEAHLGGFVTGLLLFPLLAPKVARVQG